MEELLKKLVKHGGKIVCTSELSGLEIGEAQADNRMYIDKEGFGYVLVQKEGMPVFILKAKDKLAFNTIADYYHSSCLTAGCSSEFIKNLEFRIYEFKEWIEANTDKMKMPG